MKYKYLFTLMMVYCSFHAEAQQQYTAYFECNYNKTYYVTDIQKYTISDGLSDSRHFEYGFAEKMGWLNDKSRTYSGKIHFFNDDWLADNTKWRQQHIDNAIARGFNVVHIEIPLPKVEKTVNVQSGSQQ